jgi:hypothetical protein
MSEHAAINTAAPATHCRSNPVSGRHLLRREFKCPPETVGDFASEFGELGIGRPPAISKTPRSAGAYAIHDPTISGWNDPFAPHIDDLCHNSSPRPLSMLVRCWSRWRGHQHYRWLSTAVVSIWRSAEGHQQLRPCRLPGVWKSAIACDCWSPQERFHGLPAIWVWANPSPSQQGRARSISPSIAAQMLHLFVSIRRAMFNGISRQLVRHSDMYGIGVNRTADRGFRLDGPSLGRVPRNRTCREVAGMCQPSPPILRAPPLRHRSSDSVEIAGDLPFDAPVDEHPRDHRDGRQRG